MCSVVFGAGLGSGFGFGMERVVVVVVVALVKLGFVLNVADHLWKQMWEPSRHYWRLFFNQCVCAHD